MPESHAGSTREEPEPAGDEDAPSTGPSSRLQAAAAFAPVREPLPGEMGSLAALRADEERLAKLRKELEELKNRDGFQQPAETWIPEDDRFSPRGIDGLLDVTSTSLGGIPGEGADLNSTLGLTAWCDELDAALKTAGDLGSALEEPDPEDPDATQLLSMENIGDVELRLQEAGKVVGQMEQALESACGRMNEQLEELDRLQAECDEYQAQMAVPRAG